MSRSESGDGDPERIWLVPDLTESTARRWFSNFGRVVGGVPAIPAVPTHSTIGCENCRHPRRTLYQFANALGVRATCRACLGDYPAIAAIVDERSELDALDVDVTEVGEVGDR